MPWTDDPVHDAMMHDTEQERRLERLPHCCDCDEPIQQEFAYYINGEWICDSCMDSYRREVMEE